MRIKKNQKAEKPCGTNKGSELPTGTTNQEVIVRQKLDQGIRETRAEKVQTV